MRRRHWAFMLVLFATLLGVVAYVPRDKPQIVEARQADRPAREQLVAMRALPAAGTVPLVGTLRDRSADEPSEVSLFANRSWQPSAQLSTPDLRMDLEAPSLPEATVPSIPFRYLGRYEVDEGQAVFLEFQQQGLVARTGEILAGVWKVEAIEPSRMVLLYLPMNEKRMLEWSTTP